MVRMLAVVVVARARAREVVGGFAAELVAEFVATPRAIDAARAEPHVRPAEGGAAREDEKPGGRSFWPRSARATITGVRWWCLVVFWIAGRGSWARRVSGVARSRGAALALGVAPPPRDELRLARAPRMETVARDRRDRHRVRGGCVEWSGELDGGRVAGEVRNARPPSVVWLGDGPAPRPMDIRFAINLVSHVRPWTELEWGRARQGTWRMQCEFVRPAMSKAPRCPTGAGTP